MIRQPAVAGYFYAGQKTLLEKQIQEFLTQKEKKLKVKAIIVPHAGYMYSGSVAGEVYSSTELPERFILLCPNHTGDGADFDFSPASEWLTPLGKAKVDEDLRTKLLEQFRMGSVDGRAHAREHALEVQIPFLQQLKSDFRFVPICIRDFKYEHLEALGHAIARVIQSGTDEVLIVSSTDMTHYETQQSANRKDHLAIEQMKKVDPRGLYNTIHHYNISMCGYLPTTVTLVACQDLGATTGILLKYATSGDVTHDYDSVVGYAGMAIL